MPFGFVKCLLKLVQNPLYPSMAVRQSSALNKVLDGQDDVPWSLTVEEQGATQVNGRASSSDVGMVDLVQDEHCARVKAEGDALDKASRLRVAQEQLAEYAIQKDKDSAALLSQAEEVQAMAREVLLHHGLETEAGKLLHSVQLLYETLSEAACEARAFAEQQKADIERYKRTSQQAELESDEMDTDIKRLRESSQEDAGVSDQVDERSTDFDGEYDGVVSTSYNSYLERAKYIPLRLKLDERRLLRLLEAALNVSEYTDKVDVLVWRNKNGRIHAQIKGICAILSGLVVAQDYKKGQALVQDRTFKENSEFFQHIFELGRRYKIMNPDKMRSEYGKLMYFLMDSSDPSIQELLEFKCVRPLQTVYNFLEERSALTLLEDPLMDLATAEITSRDRPRFEVQRDIKTKERAREALSRKYRSSCLSEDEVLWCLYSFSDNNSYLLFNRDPIDRMLEYFKQYFDPMRHDPGFSLAITGGRNGARLTHSHERQYFYVLQSLMLWRELSTDMFKLWYLAEEDMLREGNRYRLCDTGQGLNRVQSAPAISRAAHQILQRCQHSLGHWVGSSVIHLGDYNVPNALMFIDKYAQVPRILNPVVAVLDELPSLYNAGSLRGYIDSMFGGLEGCRKAILVDFCRHAFDGSGADNFYDAGSCIDGRLTSAWNWCTKVEKKPFYPIFKLAGFHGFDGDFQK